MNMSGTEHWQRLVSSHGILSRNSRQHTSHQRPHCTNEIYELSLHAYVVSLLLLHVHAGVRVVCLVVTWLCL